MNKQLHKSKSMVFAIGEEQAADARPKLQSLTLQIQSEYGLVTLSMSCCPRMVLGRSDSQSTVDIDLTSFGAFDKGVSRTHAVLVQRGQQLVIQDLNSTNGTRINGKLLKAGAFYDLRDKDELQLGRLKLQMIFSNLPASALTALPIEQFQSKDASTDDDTVVDIRNIDCATDT